ncbi:hypothetical protein QF015_002334 [Paenarthrobacter sp. TE4293]|uniref:hypothetical protein n=1 Tax=Paenarthrobacter sp. TE4293 TaxID=3381695 RepID=UPI003D1BA0E5
MSTIDLSQTHTIHLGVDETQFERLTRDASTCQMMVFQLDLTGIVGRIALADYLAQEFMYPFPTWGLDAATSLISDLEWFGNTNGYVVIARGLSEPSEVGETFVSLLPNITERWQTQGTPFIVAIDGKGDGLRSSLKDANDYLDEFAKNGGPGFVGYQGPIQVVVHEDV